MEISVESIKITHNVRTDVNAGLKDMMWTIEKTGLLHPIGIAPDPQVSNEYILGWGGRRLEAMKRLGYTKLVVGRHVIVTSEPMTEEEFYIKNVEENLHRRAWQGICVASRVEIEPQYKATCESLPHE